MPIDCSRPRPRSRSPRSAACDGTISSLSQEQQDAAVKFTFPMFSNPMTADEFLAKFEAGKSVLTKTDPGQSRRDSKISNVGQRHQGRRQLSWIQKRIVSF
eukprot:XP_001691556.1 predicted protein [Chlamydomonas reinhardtii]